ncbi:MAG: hypothetical protein PHP53_01955 [Prolixibacteraceae bacterium]|nr:hypothetical protein [Prolixibacteraceae bacterium]
MPAIVEGFKEVFGILKDLFSGVKSAIQIPENHKKEMRDAIADTAALIDETLTILKLHLNSVVSELRFGDKQRAKQLIYELGDFQGWEAKYRQFQLCDSLRIATDKLQSKGLYKLLNKASFENPETIHQRMFDYIGGETNAARSVGSMLQELAQLSDTVDSDPEMVAKELEAARNEIGKWRQTFIDLEIEIRNSI